MKNLVQIFLLINFVAVILSVARTFSEMKSRFPKSVMTNFGITLVIYFAVALFSHSISQLLFVITINFGWLLPFIFEQIVSKYLQTKLRKDFLLFLNTVQLNLNLGFGFRSAMQESLPNNNPYFVFQIKKMLEFVVYSQQSSIGDLPIWWQQTILELRQIDSTPHMAKKRLENYRKKLQDIQNFRHRSSQATAQVRLQMYVLGALFLSLLCFSIYNNGFSKYKNVYFLASGLFIAGMLACVYIYRRWEWKV